MMRPEENTTIDSAIRSAIAHTERELSMTPEEIIELAEMGRRDPMFEDKMAAITSSTSAFAIYSTARKTRQSSSNLAAKLAAGLKAIPDWFASTIQSMAAQPVPTYRAGSESAINLANQSISLGEALPEGVKVETGLEPGLVFDAVLEVKTSDWTLSGVSMAKMRVLTSEEEERFLWAQNCSSDAPVAASLAYYSIGRFADADNLLSAWPEDSELDDYKNLIRATCQARRADARRLF